MNNHNFKYLIMLIKNNNYIMELLNKAIESDYLKSDLFGFEHMTNKIKNPTNIFCSFLNFSITTELAFIV